VACTIDEEMGTKQLKGGRGFQCLLPDGTLIKMPKRCRVGNQSSHQPDLKASVRGATRLIVMQPVRAGQKL
jgi:hypothetical protein